MMKGQASKNFRTVANTENINGLEDSTTTTNKVTLDEDRRADVFVGMFRELKDNLIESSGNIFARVTTGHQLEMNKAFEIGLNDTTKHL